MARPADHVGSGRLGFLVADQASHRCGSGRHQRPGPDQRRSSGADASRNREAGHRGTGDGAGRHARPGIDAVFFAKRFCPDHGRVHRPHQYLLCAPAGFGAHQRSQGQSSARRRYQARANLNGTWRDLLVGGRIRQAGRRQPGAGWATRLAIRRDISHARR